MKAHPRLLPLVGLLILLSACQIWAGTIAGVVHQPLAPPPTDLRVCAHPGSGTPVCVNVNPTSGAYAIEGLPEGPYRVGAFGTGLNNQFWNHVATLELATVLSVPATGRIGDINFDMTAPGAPPTDGRIAGQIHNCEGGTLIPGAVAHAQLVGTTPILDNPVDGTGHYNFPHLPYGNYIVWATAPDFDTRWFDGAVNREGATPIAVTDSLLREAHICLPLHVVPTGVVHGYVYQFGGSTPIVGATVTISGGGVTFTATTGPAGGYEIRIPLGIYTAQAAMPGFLTQWYLDAATAEAATSFEVTAAGIGDINFHLSAVALRSGIYGNIHTADSLPLPTDCIVTVTSEGGTPIIVHPNAYGVYVADAPAGNYLVTCGATGYLVQYWDHVGDAALATLVLVTEGHITPGINFNLLPDAPPVEYNHIYGHVTFNSAPRYNAEVCAEQCPGTTPICTHTNADGNYTLTVPVVDCPTFVRSSTEAMTQWWDHVTERTAATAISFDPAGNADGINFDFVYTPPDTHHATLHGIVNAASCATPTTNLHVSCMVPGTTHGFTDATIGADGAWSIELPAGTYICYAGSAVHLAQWFDHQTEMTAANPITVAPGGIMDGINFDLACRDTTHPPVDTMGVITGIVNAPPCPAPLTGLRVTCANLDISGVSYTTDHFVEGRYSIIARPGTYVCYALSTVHRSQVYDHVSSSGEATHIPLAAADTAININFDLACIDTIPSIDTTHAIMGGVATWPRCSLETSGMHVSCLNTGDSSFFSTTYFSGGQWRLNVPPGTYICYAGSATHNAQFYNHVTESGAATPIVLAAGDTNLTINFDLVCRTTPPPTEHHIYGTVTMNGNPRNYAEVCAEQCAGGTPICTRTDSLGHYMLTVPASDCPTVVRSSTEGMMQWWNHVTERTAASPVVWGPLGNVDGINFDFVYTPHADTLMHLTGVVHAPPCSTPTTNLHVSCVNIDHTGIYGATDHFVEGVWSLALIPGTYVCYAGSAVHRAQSYDHVDSFSLATHITGVAGDTVLNINFDLACLDTTPPPVVDTTTISGFVTLNGAPDSGVGVCASFCPGSRNICATTDGRGHYVMTVPVDTCDVFIHAYGPGTVQWWNHVSTRDSATALLLSAEHATEGINFDFTLTPPDTARATLMGVVNTEDCGVPTTGLRVSCYGSGTGFNTTTFTDAGAWSMRVPAGVYICYAVSDQHLSQVYDHVAGGDSATSITVVAGATFDHIDFDLACRTHPEEHAYITGNVTWNGTPAARVQVCADLCDAATPPVCTTTDAHGNYILTMPLVTCDIFVHSTMEGMTQYWDHVAERTAATGLHLSPSDTIAGINFGFVRTPPETLRATLTGVVTAADCAIPTTGLHVACMGTGASFTTDAFGPAGGWSLSVPAGVYFCVAGSDVHVAQWYNHVATRDLATSITVAAGATFDGINFELACRDIPVEHGYVTGTVTWNGLPRVGAEVCADQCVGATICTRTDSLGHYVLVLPVSDCPTYVRSSVERIAQYWDHVATHEAATTLTIVAGDAIEGINFDFVAPIDTTRATLAGVVNTEACGVPTTNLRVTCYGAGTGFNTTHFSGTGEWSMSVPAGVYVCYAVSDQHLSQVYDHVSGTDSATTITVAAGATFGHIDFDLICREHPAEHGYVTGTVTLNGLPRINAEVCAEQCPGTAPICTHTDSLGRYALLLPVVDCPTYVRASVERIVQWWDHTAERTAATTLTIVAGSAIEGINFDFTTTPHDTTGIINGVVRGADCGTPVEGYTVNCVSTEGHSFTATTTGEWRMVVPAGTYVCVAESRLHLPQWYNHVVAATEATNIEVAAGTTVSHIDFDLACREVPAEHGLITGIVTWNGTARAGVEVCAEFCDPTTPAICATTNREGRYWLTLPIVDCLFTIRATTERMVQWWDHQTDRTLATGIAVSAGDTVMGVNFDFVYTPPARCELMGIITDAVTGNPIPNAHMALYPVGATAGLHFYSRADGSWEFFTAAGTYVLSAEARGYVPEWFNDVAFDLRGEATVTTLSDPATPLTVEMNLTPVTTALGSIAGIVLNGDGLPVLASVCVAPWGSPLDVLFCVNTNRDGGYVIEGLASGEYLVSANAPGYHAQWYDGATDPEGATSIAVSSSRVEGINFHLEAIPVAHRGVVTGVVTDETTGDPLPGVTVLATAIDGRTIVARAISDEFGAYRLELETGSYVLNTMNTLGYVDEWFNNVFTREEATPIEITSDGALTADFVLAQSSLMISGYVTPWPSSTPITVSAVLGGRDSDPYRVFTVVVGPSADPAVGYYEIHGLMPGTYTVNASGPGYAIQFFDHVAAATEATPVVLADASAENVNFDLTALARYSISGTVIDSVSGAGLPNINVTVFLAPDTRPHRPTPVANILTDADGNYNLEVIEGVYKVGTMDRAGTYRTEFYNEKPDFLTADPIAVAGPVTGINFTLTTNPVAAYGSILGRIYDDGGTPIPHATVVAFPTPVAGPSISVVADAEGNYNFARLLAGGYLILGVAPYHVPTFYIDAVIWEDATPVLVAVGASVTGIDIVLPAVPDDGGYGRFGGDIIPEDGGFLRPATELARGARVYAIDDNGAPVGYAITDAEGHYTIEGLKPGNYTITADLDGYTHGSYPTIVVCDYTSPTTEGLDIYLYKAGVAHTTLPAVTSGAIKAWPNPATDLVRVLVNLPATWTSAVRVDVTDLLGRSVAVLADRQATGTLELVWSADVASGTYLVRASCGAASMTFTIEKK